MIKVKTYSASFNTNNVPASSEKTFEFDISELQGKAIVARIPYLHNNGFIPATVKLGSVSNTSTSVRVYNTNANSAISSGAVYLCVIYV